MLRTALIAALASATLMGSEVAEIAFHRSRGVVKALSSSGELSLQTTSTQLEVNRDSGSVDRGNLAVIWDPSTKYYVWHLYPALDPSDTSDITGPAALAGVAIFVDRSGMYLFNIPGPDVGVLIRQQKAESLELAKSASIAEIRAGLPNLEKNGYDPGFKEVEVGAAIGRSWACPPADEPGGLDPLCHFSPKAVPLVERDGDRWKIVVRNRWDEEITLGPDFQLIGVRALPNRVEIGRPRARRRRSSDGTSS